MKQVTWMIFDMDGLLIDTERLYQQCWEEVFSLHGYTSISDEERMSMVGMGLGAAIDFFENKFGSKEKYWELREHREKIFWDFIDAHGLPVKKGAYDLLAWAKKHNIFCAIASSTYQERALKLLGKTEILQYIDDAVFGDMVQQTKPAPDIFLHVINKHQLDKSHGLIFEDSLNGVLAANRSHVDVCWVEDLVDLRNRSDVTLQYVVSSLIEAKETLEKLERA